MAAAARQPESQEDILAAALASLTEADIPPEDDRWPVQDPDSGRPAEFAALTGPELDELADAALAADYGAWDGGVLRAAADARSGERNAREPWARADAGSQAREDTGFQAREDAGLWAREDAGSWAGEDAGLWAREDAAFRVRDGGLRWAGFAQDGVLDMLPAGLPLAGFADEAHQHLSHLTDDELVGVLRAWRRQTSWAQAREMAAVAELARRRPAGDHPVPAPGQLPADLNEFLAAEVAMALTLTRRGGDLEVSLAVDLAHRRATAAALEAGRIDLAKARIMLDGVSTLTDAHAAAVEAAALPVAPGMTTGELRAEVARLVLAADPAAARRQREQDEQEARVECWVNPTGTASLSGRNLPSAAALAADKRLCQVAAHWKKQLRAAWKQADPDGRQPRPASGTDLLRARAYLALLLGQPVSDPPADLLPPAGTAADGDPAEPSLPPLAGSIHLTLPLTTLLGLSDSPGAAAGYGPIDPDTARALARAAAGHPVASWHLIITDPRGRAVGYGYAPRAKPIRGHPADGWTITLTTERIARGHSP